MELCVNSIEMNVKIQNCMIGLGWVWIGAVAWGAGEEMVMEEVQVSPPHPMEIRIKVVSTSLCRSDVTAWLSQVSFSISPPP